jgi:hypothetical protein
VVDLFDGDGFDPVAEGITPQELIVRTQTMSGIGEAASAAQEVESALRHIRSTRVA